jgi:DNA-binding GntR family transcriptional regulator
LVADHEAIYQAIVDRDGEAAKNAMRRHLRRVLSHTGRLAREHAEWFSD